MLQWLSIRKDFIHSIVIIMIMMITVEVALAQNKQLTNLPTININTYDGEIVNQKDIYKYCRLEYIDGGTIVQYDSVQIKRRGNSYYEKYPYRLKFPKKVKLAGERYASAKSWNLLSNGGDKLLFRNGLANKISELYGMPFTPSAVYCDVYFNNQYVGNYQITDYLDIRKKRVDIYEQKDSLGGGRL